MTSIIHREIPPESLLALQAAGLPSLMSRLFAARGITGIDQVSVNLNRLLPPQTLTHNQMMAKLLADAIEANKKLLIIGDLLRS